MDFEVYKNKALRTADFKGLSLNSVEVQLMCGAIGMASETGEALDHIKKWAFQEHDLDEELLIEEAGDVLWYWAIFCDALQKLFDCSVSEITEYNIDKLLKRYPNGFEPDRSINREENHEQG